MAYVSLVEVFQEGKASFKDAFDIMAKEHVENEGMILFRNSVLGQIRTTSCDLDQSP